MGEHQPDPELQRELARAEIDLQKIDATQPAKEVASRFIGKWGFPLIVLLVCVGVFSAKFLPSEALTPVIGLVASSVTALIGIIIGITGTKDKEEKPEFKLMHSMLERIGEKEPPMKVDVENGKVTVSKGHDTVTMKEREHA